MQGQEDDVGPQGNLEEVHLFALTLKMDGAGGVNDVGDAVNVHRAQGLPIELDEGGINVDGQIDKDQGNFRHILQDVYVMNETVKDRKIGVSSNDCNSLTTLLFPLSREKM